MTIKYFYKIYLVTDDTSLKTLNDAYNYTHEKRIKSFDVFVDSWEGPGYD